MLPRAKVVLQSGREPPSIGLGPVGGDHEMTRRCTVPAPIGNPAKTGEYVAFSLEIAAIHERQGCGFRALCRAVSEVLHLIWPDVCQACSTKGPHERAFCWSRGRRARAWRDARSD